LVSIKIFIETKKNYRFLLENLSKFFFAEESNKKRKGVKLYEIKPGHESLLNSKKISTKEKSLPFSKRVNLVAPTPKLQIQEDGNMQMTFVPEIEKEKKNSSVAMREEWVKNAAHKRGVKELKLAKPRIRGSRGPRK
jgi:hypothetical protein